MSKYDQSNLEQLEGRLAQHTKNLNHVEDQISQYPGRKSAPVKLINESDEITIEINLIKEAINQKRNQISSITKVTDQSTISSPNPSKIQTKEIQIAIDDDINRVDDTYIKNLQNKLAIKLEINPNQVKISKHFNINLRFIIEIPEDSAHKLLKLYLTGKLIIEGLKVTEVIFEPHAQIGATSMNSKLELTEPKAMIKAAWIGAVAVIIAAIIGIFKFGASDTFNYQVEVLDNSTNKPISQAKVTITLPNLAPLEAFTDSNGFARLSIGDQYNDQAGILRIEKTGYDSATFNVDIQADRLPKQIKLVPNQSNSPQPTATEAAAAAPTDPPSQGELTATLLIGCWNNDKKPRGITNINIRESASGIKIGFKTDCTDSTISDEQDAVISSDNEITLIKTDETWVISLRGDGTLKITIVSQSGFEELTFYKK